MSERVTEYPGEKGKIEASLGLGLCDPESLLPPEEIGELEGDMTRLKASHEYPPEGPPPIIN